MFVNADCFAQDAGTGFCGRIKSFPVSNGMFGDSV